MFEELATCQCVCCVYVSLCVLCMYIYVCISLTCSRLSVCLFSLAAVDYLTKNVSLSTQRRMKLGDHSAVLGLLQVETGQAY